VRILHEGKGDQYAGRFTRDKAREPLGKQLNRLAANAGARDREKTEG
jgi:hypothetical protein